MMAKLGSVRPRESLLGDRITTIPTVARVERRP